LTTSALPAVTGLALLAAWLGAAILVAAAVAPAAFAVLPSRALAGALVGRVLPVVFWTGMAVGIAVAAGCWGLPHRVARTGAALAMAAACAIAQLAVAPRIQRIREQAGGVMEALDPADPRRQAFGRLHGMSVAWMGVAALAACVALVLLARHVTSRSVP
jgi:hypothetical protein